jgi:hypothetical protein
MVHFLIHFHLFSRILEKMVSALWSTFIYALDGADALNILFNFKLLFTNTTNNLLLES